MHCGQSAFSAKSVFSKGKMPSCLHKEVVRIEDIQRASLAAKHENKSHYSSSLGIWNFSVPWLDLWVSSVNFMHIFLHTSMYTGRRGEGLEILLILKRALLSWAVDVSLTVSYLADYFCAQCHMPVAHLWFLWGYGRQFLWMKAPSHFIHLVILLLHRYHWSCENL